jgi:hypothetical protein
MHQKGRTRLGESYGEEKRRAKERSEKKIK